MSNDNIGFNYINKESGTTIGLPFEHTTTKSIDFSMLDFEFQNKKNEHKKGCWVKCFLSELCHKTKLWRNVWRKLNKTGTIQKERLFVIFLESQWKKSNISGRFHLFAEYIINLSEPSLKKIVSLCYHWSISHHTC